MVELIVTRGIPASGKSTWAKAWVAEDVRHRARVERDMLRAMMHDSVWKGSHTENQIITARDTLIKSLLRSGVSVVCSDTNLDLKTFNHLRYLAAEWGYGFKMQDFRDVPLTVCLSRNIRRKGKEFIPEDVIIGMHKRYVEGK